MLPSYHCLVILVARASAGKTAALQDVHSRTLAPLVNVNIELSWFILDCRSGPRTKLPQSPRRFGIGATNEYR